MSTTTTYNTIEKNLANYQKQTASLPAVKTATAYYKANIGKVTSINQFVSNYRLLSYALQAYGLGDQVGNTSLIKQVLQQGTSSSKALANTLPNANWKAFANAYKFSATGTSSPTSSTSVATTVSNYVEQQLEANQGQSDPGVELALYFQRVAPALGSSGGEGIGYAVLADENLYDVVKTVFNLPDAYSSAQLDQEATEIGKLVTASTLQSPAKLTQLVDRFTAAYDATDPDLTVKNDNVAGSSATTGASSVLTNLVSSNATYLASSLPANSFSASLLYKLQGLSLGG